MKIDKGLFSGGFTKGLVLNLLKPDNLMTVIKTATKTTTDTVSLFKSARENARMSGKLLGHYLSQGLQFDSYSVSLIGFSLGSQVIKSCLNTL